MFYINRHHRLITACVGLVTLLSASVFAAVLSSAPVQLSDSGLQQGQLLGWSLALSADGQVAAGGAPAYNRSDPNGTDNTGAAYVYMHTSGTWSSPITLSTNGIAVGGQLGIAMAVSPNGQQVFVGGPDLNTYTGAVYVYTEANGGWGTTPARVALALPAGITTDSSFGFGLAISSDGQTLIVGASHAAGSGSSPGALYAYSLSGTTWDNPVPLPMGSIPNGAGVGGSIAVSANGQVVVAGAPQENSARGAVYVWVKNGGTWGSPVELALPSTLGGAGVISFFGNAVAISADGSVVLAGAPGANNTTGAGYVYTDTGGTWSTTPVMLSTTLANANSFGTSVALSPNGQTAFIGMPINNIGYVYASTQTNGTWNAPAALSTSNLPVNAFVGEVLAQADNGEELLTTGEDVNNDTGALFVYDSPAAVTLAVSPSATAVAPGSSLTFDLTLTNADQPGSMLATTLNNVVLTDTLPTGTTYVSSNAANGSCTDASRIVTCTLTSLGPGNNSQNPWAPSITVKTPATAAALTNTLGASANEPLVGTTTVSTKVTNDVAPTLKSGNLSTAIGAAVSGTLNATVGFTGQMLTFSIVSQPSNGSVTLTDASTGAFTYMPNPGFSGADTFVWTAGDGVVSASPVAESIAVGTSSGGSGSSGKSGGGAMGIPTLALLALLMWPLGPTRRVRQWRYQRKFDLPWSTR